MSWMTSRYSSSIFCALEAGEAREPHLEDRVRLDLAQARSVAMSPCARRLDVGRGLDQRDDLVDVVEGDLEALEDVRAPLGLGEVELGAPDAPLPAGGSMYWLDHLPQRERHAAGCRPAPACSRRRWSASGVCLKSWFRTTLGCASRFSSITMRMPSRSDSSRRSEMPSSVPVLHQVRDLLEERRLVHHVGDLGRR